MIRWDDPAPEPWRKAIAHGLLLLVEAVAFVVVLVAWSAR